MPFLFITTTDDRYHAWDDGAQYASNKQARSVAVRAAAHLAVDHLRQGSPSSTVEARLERRDGTVADRLAVAVSVAHLHAD